MLSPIWRCYPNGTGVAAIALDPVEAEVVLERGWALLDDARYRVIPITTSVEGDGRIPVRLELAA